MERANVKLEKQLAARQRLATRLPEALKALLDAERRGGGFGDISLTRRSLLVRWFGGDAPPLLQSDDIAAAWERVAPPNVSLYLECLLRDLPAADPTVGAASGVAAGGDIEDESECVGHSGGFAVDGGDPRLCQVSSIVRYT